MIRRSFFIVRALSTIALFLVLSATSFPPVPAHGIKLDELLQADPHATRSVGRSVEELIDQAEAAYDRAELSRAVSQYQQAVNMLPGSCLTHRARGLTAQIQGKLTDAIDSYQKALACDPEDYLAMEKLARIYEHRGEKIQEAAELYRKASQLHPRPNRRQDLITWASFLKNRLAGSDTSAARLWNECGEHVVRAEWERARQCYSQVITLDPASYQAFFSRASVLMEIGDHEAAIRDLDAGLKLSPIYPGGYVARGLAHEKIGNAEEAARDFELATETDGMDPSGYYHLGRTHEKKQQVGEALTCYRKALGLGPGRELVDAIQRRMTHVEKASRQSMPSERDMPGPDRKHLW